MSESYRERVIRMTEERGEFVTGDDGYVIFWPEGKHGGLSEVDLIILSEELHRRNEAWDAQVQAEVNQ